MIIYLIVFALSAVCIAVSESIQAENRIGRWSLLCMGLLLPAALAGLRASSVGTDVTLYGISAYEWAAQWLLDPAAYISACIDSYGNSLLFDQLFWILVYLCCWICRDYHFGLFIYNLILIVFLYLGLKRCLRIYAVTFENYKADRKNVAKVSDEGGDDPNPTADLKRSVASSDVQPLVMSFGMLTFYILLYNRSLNLMRLMIAVTMVFYAGTFLLEQRYARAGITWVIAILFHSSALLGAGFVVLYLLSRRKPENGLIRDLIRVAVAAVGLILLFLLMTPLVKSLVNAGLLRENYLDYLPDVSYAEMNLEYSWQMFLWMMFKKLFYPDGIMAAGLFLISLAAYVHEIRYDIDLHKDNGDRLFLVMCSAVYMIIELASMNSYEWFRAAYYFLPFAVADHSMLLPGIIRLNGRKKGAGCAAGYLFFLLIIWYIMYCILGDCETVPYLFLWQE